MRHTPPIPEVQYLPAIFRKIQNGIIRIPAFQRDFVWEYDQVISLLESLYKGYPVGSVLLWKVESKKLKVESTSESVFPVLDEVYPLNYVLDGLQRLTALYGCFHFNSLDKESIFNVVFDLDDETFSHYKCDNQPDHYIHLSKIFSPKDFIESQTRLSQSPNADKLLDVAVKLHSTFQEYMIPTVTISDRSVDDVVAIFERINNTGTKLGTVDFLRASTWSEDFDLNAAIEEISINANLFGFKIPDETIIKLLAISVHEDPTSDAMLNMRNKRPEQLQEGVINCIRYLLDTITILQSHCCIYCYDFIPYEAQLLVLFKYVSDNGRESDIKPLLSWFWSISLNEWYRGKADSYLVKDIKSAGRYASFGEFELSVKLNVTSEDIVSRQFIKGKALSAAIANLFAMRQAKSIITGHTINHEYYMSEFSSNNYAFILTVEEVKKVSYKYKSNKILANIILIDEDDLLPIKRKSLREYIIDIHLHGDTDNILISQMICSDCVSALRDGNDDLFLKIRAQNIIDTAIDVIIY